MDRFKRFSETLKFRLALACVLLITACVALATQLVLQRVHRGVEQAVMDLETGNAERMASLVSSRVIGLQMALRSLADDPSFVALAGDPQALRQRLASSAVLRTMFASIFVARPEGRVVALCDSDGARDPQLDIGDRPYFQQTVKQARPVVSEPMLGRVSREPIIQLTVPVSAPGGALVAVVGGTLRLSSRNLLDELTQGGQVADDPVTTIVIDGRGRIVSHRLPERVMQPAASEPGLAAAMQRWEAQGRPVESMGDVVRADDRIVASAGVPVADWVVLRIAREDTLLGGVAAAQRDSLRLAAAVALAGGLLLLALLLWLLRPLTQLQQRALALGDADRPIDQGWPHAAGEIGQLSAVLRRAMRDRAASEHDAAALLRKMQSVMAAAPIGIALTRERRFELVSPEFATVLGWQHEDLVGRQARDIYATDLDYERLGPCVAEAFGAGRPFVGEMQFRRRDGSTLWGRLQGRPVDPEDAGAGTIWLLEDVTLRRAEHERLAWSANHDALTRLANRASFEARLAALLAEVPRPEPSALLFIDLDRFKAINDSAGHAAGDAVLKDVAALLNSLVRGADLVARLGGDEFALLLPHCERGMARRIAGQVEQAAAQIGVEHAGRRIHIGASVGVVTIEAGDHAVAALLARADAACYEAKRAGRDIVRTAAAAGTADALDLANAA